MIPAAPRESRDPNDLVPSGVPAPAADEVVVLCEPVMTAAGMVEATAANLQRLREVTTALGIVLIFVPVSTVGGPTELMDLLEPDAHDGQAPMGVMSTFGGNQVGMAAGIACLEKLARDRARSPDRDPLGGGAGGRLPDPAAGRPGKGDQHQPGPGNDGYYQTFTGLFLLSTVLGDQEIDGFLLALERSLHTLGYVS